MASNAAVPFWRAAGMTYITYSNICANLVRNCLKDPYKTRFSAARRFIFPFPSGRTASPKSQLFGRIILKREGREWIS
ncbi:hypothetical protein SDJN03_13069, partial [Cucurbita argyrosperma subsp. sororia]